VIRKRLRSTGLPDIKRPAQIASRPAPSDS
jgi:hypothetical protein